MGMRPALDRDLCCAARGPAGTLLALVAAGALLAVCSKDGGGPRRREAAPERDGACTDPERPRAYFYPAQNRHYEPDDPWKDGCAMLVPDHLFCCPGGGGADAAP